MSCEARRYGDETVCARCGLRWDTNDPEPPACKPVGKQVVGHVIGAARVTPLPPVLVAESTPVRVVVVDDGSRAVRRVLEILAASPGSKWKDRR